MGLRLTDVPDMLPFNSARKDWDSAAWWAEGVVFPTCRRSQRTHHTAGAPDTPPVLYVFLIVRTNQDQSAPGVFPRRSPIERACKSVSTPGDSRPDV
jgi:hypothetical protein